MKSSQNKGSRSMRDDWEPFVLPDGRTTRIKYTFVVSPDKPVTGRYGHFEPERTRVTWADRSEQRCLYFGAGPQALEYAREKAASRPGGPEREQAYKEYLRCRKYLWSEMIGRVVCVEGDKDPQDIWVVGVEETSTTDFEIMLDRHK